MSVSEFGIAGVAVLEDGVHVPEGVDHPSNDATFSFGKAEDITSAVQGKLAKRRQKEMNDELQCSTRYSANVFFVNITTAKGVSLG